MGHGGYKTDLAFIHDAGFRAYSLGAAPGLLRILQQEGVAGGLIVDLGCGRHRRLLRPQVVASTGT